MFLFLCSNPIVDYLYILDSVYTERYMKTPAENPDGYRVRYLTFFLFSGGMFSHEAYIFCHVEQKFKLLLCGQEKSVFCPNCSKISR